MTLDEQELANCRREIKRLLSNLKHHERSAAIAEKRVTQEVKLKQTILARIEAAKGSTDGN